MNWIERGDLWGAGCGVNHPTKPSHPNAPRITRGFRRCSGVKRKSPHTPAESRVTQGFERGGVATPYGGTWDFTPVPRGAAIPSRTDPGF